MHHSNLVHQIPRPSKPFLFVSFPDNPKKHISFNDLSHSSPSRLTSSAISPWPINPRPECWLMERGCSSDSDSRGRGERAKITCGKLALKRQPPRARRVNWRKGRMLTTLVRFRGNAVPSLSWETKRFPCLNNVQEELHRKGFRTGVLFIQLRPIWLLWSGSFTSFDTCSGTWIFAEELLSINYSSPSPATLLRTHDFRV